MQLICSDNRGLEDRLTIGKIYKGTLEGSHWFTISDDEGKEDCDFYEWRFSNIQDWREKQLDKILI